MITTDKAKPTLKNIIAYIQGNLRYKLFYSNFAFLIRPHIREQIEVRINSMDQECYNAGECKLCGCQTTALQMANKACDKPCYPSMLSKEQWYVINKNYPVYDEETRLWWSLFNNKFISSAYKSYEHMIDSQPKPNSKLEESNIELFKSCEADIKVPEPFTLEDLINGKLIKEAIVPNNNCE